ncbi:hypothetical protein, partial [Escherichia coli]
MSRAAFDPQPHDDRRPRARVENGLTAVGAAQIPRNPIRAGRAGSCLRSRCQHRGEELDPVSGH